MNTLQMNPADAGAMVSEMIPDFQSTGRFKALGINHLWLNRFPGKLEEGETGEVWTVSYTHLTLPTNREV